MSIIKWCKVCKKQTYCHGKIDKDNVITYTCSKCNTVVKKDVYKQ